MNILEQKDLERNIFKNLRAKNSSIERENVAKNVKIYIETVFKKEFKNKYIGIYWPLKYEVDLRSLRLKYSCALPRCEKNNKLSFSPWEEENLIKDNEGIPSPSSSNILGHDQISMIFIPCLAVDKDFIRLGYGGGYFDRLRENQNWKKIPFIGVLTSNCLSKNLLAKADWDIPLSGLITEKEILV